MLTDPRVTLVIFVVCVGLVVFAVLFVLAALWMLVALWRQERAEARRPLAIVIELDTSRARRAQVRRRRDTHHRESYR